MARQPDLIGTERRRWWPWIAMLAALSVAAPAVAPPPEPVPPEQGDAAQEEDLSERLIRQAVGDQDRDIMDQITRLMDQSARRLHREFDPGRQTQAVQQQIVKTLDQAIAAAQRRRAKASASARPTGDRRTTPPKPDRPRDSADATAGDQPPETTAGGPGGADAPPATGRFRESRRGWGHLPARDRDEILQGLDEDVLEKYRSLIDRYFKALAEDDQE